jgi:hypothetical protein
MQRGLGGFPHERYAEQYPLGLHQEVKSQKFLILKAFKTFFYYANLYY